ncbi:unnamed protein product [Callosobruchus maculatus]|uniref:Uncharacterized protein n=1 Tax=Callosobruchus maculatus TaxID=64391 RepID=A0A653BZ99_CALMS|nr:unnamed protein product [Callosobruchus maculatus]
MHPICISICVILVIGSSCAAPGADPVARASPTPSAKADPTPEAKAEAAAKAEARPEPIPVPVPVPSYWPSPLSAFGLYKPIFSAYSVGGLECSKYGYYPRGYGPSYGYAHPWW